jgi:alanine racemase
MSSVAKIQISKENLLSNIAEIRRNLPVGNKIAGVIKANAYGHGMKEVVSVIENNVDYLQVDDFAELKELRKYTKKPILVFGYVDESEINEFVDLGAILGVYDLHIVETLNLIAKNKNKVVRVHVKVDAFLGRQGILKETAEGFFDELGKYKNILVEAVYSHFSNIEDVSELSQAKIQHENLLEVKEIAKRAGFKDIYHHISATSGFLTDQKSNWGGEIVRFGIGLYGLWPSESLKKRYSKDITLKPVMRWVSKIVQVKKVPKNFPIGYGGTFITKEPTTIAIIPQGYSDGYDRGFSNNSEVLIFGEKCPLIGRVAMNMFVVDVTKLTKKYSSEEIIETEVVLLGKQGNNEITAEDLANKIGTINYEITTRVWPNLERVII